MTIAIIVHGGASPVPPEKVEAATNGCRAAADAGWAILAAGGSALDAVEAAIRVLEADSAFNAAYGGMLNADGDVQMDAALMRGEDLVFGSLGSAQNLRHPISVARQILEVGPLMLVGEGLIRFAEGRGAELCDKGDLITDERLATWNKHEQQRGANAKPIGSDTVGCVALDAAGQIVVGTSTGGEDHNLPGRVGDSAVPGCGFYADNTLGGCVMSGIGEAIMQVGTARTCIELLAAGLEPQEAAQQAIDALEERVDGEGGCIMLDNQGRIGWAHNSEDMPCAYRTSDLPETQVGRRQQKASD